VRAARGWLAAALGAVAVLALPATAAECVKVVVDYGTATGAPAGPNTTCVAVAYEDNAAEALAARRAVRGTPAPRYEGNFLCGIDGYPDTGCGTDSSKPYWSLWWYANGRWVYSDVGVADLAVRDRDGDGHPDPLGFRYLGPQAAKDPPRANPAYPTPSPTKAGTSAPATTRLPASGTGATPGGTGGTGAPGGGATATPAPDATGTGPAGGPKGDRTGSPTGDPVGDPTGGPDGDGAHEPAGGAVGGNGDRTGDVPRAAGGGFPVGTAVGAALALGLLGAAALKARKT
jgi:hypothetical protein